MRLIDAIRNVDRFKVDEKEDLEGEDDKKKQ